MSSQAQLVVQTYSVGTAWAAGALVSPLEIVYPRFYNGFGYTAVQAAAARTGTSEPVWPLTAGLTVVDGAVTWEAFPISTITWQAFALQELGAVEPAWPTVIGATIANGTVTMTTRAPIVLDPYCSHGRAVLVAVEKVFTDADDVVRYSATSNPLGWSPIIFPRDAGFLNTGSKMQGDPQAVALAQYRGNMAVFGYSTVQIWQLDPDPGRISLVDTIEGVGTPYPRAHASVVGDLYFTSSAGVRSLSTSSTEAGVGSTDVGTPIDELVVAQLAVAALAGYDPIGVFDPGRGEFWLLVGDRAYVLRQSKVAGFAAWSEYTLPGIATDAATLASTLYFMTTTGRIYRVDHNATTDDGVQFTVTGETAFARLGQTNGQTTTMECIASQPFEVMVRHDESDPSRVTNTFSMPAKTRPRGNIPVHLNDIPSLALVFTHTSDLPWELTELTLNHEPVSTT